MCRPDDIKKFVSRNIEWYLQLYDKFSRGKDKYVNLYLAWLDEIRTYETDEQVMNDWERIVAIFDASVNKHTKNCCGKFISCSTRGSSISLLEVEHQNTDMEVPADDIYRVSG